MMNIHKIITEKTYVLMCIALRHTAAGNSAVRVPAAVLLCDRFLILPFEFEAVAFDVAFVTSIINATKTDTLFRCCYAWASSNHLYGLHLANACLGLNI